MAGIKLERGGGWEIVKINTVVTMLNDKKDFCCLDLKYSVLCSVLDRIFVEYV